MPKRAGYTATTVIAAGLGFAAAPCVDPPDTGPIRFSSPCDCVNRSGEAQHWQTAPDEALPADFHPGGQITLAWTNEPRSLTPYVQDDFYAARVYQEVLEPLVWTDLDSLEPVPGLARRWTLSDDGLELTFDLFESARFSDGQPVTSEDVVFSYGVAMDPQMSTGQWRHQVEDLVEDCRAVNEHAVRFRLREAYFKAVEVCGSLLIIPRHVYDRYPAGVFREQIPDVCLGSGAWMLDHWTRGREIVLRRNENYWGPKPAIERQRIVFIAGALAQWNAFKAGTLDLVGASADVWTAQRDSAWVSEHATALSYVSPGQGFGMVGYNMRRGTLADKRVRQAMTMLIDRAMLLDQLRDGYGQIVTGPFYAGSPQYDASIEAWPHDPPAAARLLAQAGWSDSDGDGTLDRARANADEREKFDVTFLIPSSGQYGRVLGQHVQSSFAEAGIHVTIEDLEWAMFVQRLDARDFDMISMFVGGEATLDPRPMWHSSQVGEGGGNILGFASAKADAVMDLARRTLDPVDQGALWRQWHRIIHDEQPCTFLFNKPTFVFVNKRIANVEPHQMRLYVPQWYIPVEY